jgi:hypothetical protein
MNKNVKCKNSEYYAIYNNDTDEIVSVLVRSLKELQAEIDDYGLDVRSGIDVSLSVCKVTILNNCTVTPTFKITQDS